MALIGNVRRGRKLLLRFTQGLTDRTTRDAAQATRTRIPASNTLRQERLQKVDDLYSKNRKKTKQAIYGSVALKGVGAVGSAYVGHKLLQHARRQGEKKALNG